MPASTHTAPTFPAVKIGRRWTWDRDDVLGWYRQQPKHAAAARRRGDKVAPAAPSPIIKPYKPRERAA